VAAKQATREIPIVMAETGDPIGTGLVMSLSRPGGNVTGSHRPGTWQMGCIMIPLRLALARQEIAA
jgi:ABC transporter substrate binding protein